MPRQIKTPDGVIHNFPDEATDDQIAEALSSYNKPQTALEMLQNTGGAQDLRNMAGGVRAGIANTVFRGGDLIRQGWNKVAPESMQADRIINEPDVQAAMTRPEGVAGAIGKGVEQAAEFAVAGGPVSAVTRGAPLVARMGAEAALGAGMATVQGNSPTAGAVAGAAGPVVGKGLNAVGEWVESKAIPLVRAGVKAPLSVLKTQSGAGQTGLDVQSIKLAKFIVDNRIANPADALKIIKDSEAEIQAVMNSQAGQTLTDAPSRAMAYLDILENKAKQSLNPDAAKAIRQAAIDAIQETPIGQTTAVTKTLPGVGFGGQPRTVTTTTRSLRPDDVTAKEALETARSTTQFENLGKQYGEQKGATVEAVKTMVRGYRDAVKQALPEVRTPLQQEGQAILARTVMDRAAVREGNRDVLALPTVIAATTSNVMAVAVQFLRNNQRRAGIWADQLGKAIQGNDAATAAAILHRLGVGLTTQAVGGAAAPPAQGDIELPAEPR